MNTAKIEELANKAGITFKQMIIEGDEYDYYHVECNDNMAEDEAGCIRNFAELIVRECTQFIDDESIRLIEYQESLPEWDGNKRDDCDLVIEKCYDLSARLKQHFGVEE